LAARREEASGKKWKGEHCGAIKEVGRIFIHLPAQNGNYTKRRK